MAWPDPARGDPSRRGEVGRGLSGQFRCVLARSGLVRHGMAVGAGFGLIRRVLVRCEMAVLVWTGLCGMVRCGSAVATRQ